MWYNVRMAETISIVAGSLLLLISFIGCVVPVVPGPLLGFIGLLCARGIPPHDQPSIQMLAIAGGCVLVVTVLDYIVPALGAKRFNCSRLGVLGCVLGTVIGLFFMPLGLLLGPFLGALLGELVAGKALGPSFKGAAGAFLGYVAGIMMKLLCCGFLAAAFFRAVT